MSPLFGSKDNQVDGRQPVDIERLLALPAFELAMLILPLWASGAAAPARIQRGEYAANEIASWLAGARPSALFSAGSPFSSPLDRAVAEAIQALEHAGLLLRTFGGSSGSMLHLTRLAERALASGDVTRFLRGG